MRKLRITIGNKSYEVTVEDLTEPQHYPGAVTPPMSRPVSAPSNDSGPAPTPRQPSLLPTAGSVASPMAGVIKSMLVTVGQHVQERQPLLVLEAMKMENQITAPTDGTISRIEVNVGDPVREGQVLVVLE